MENQMSETPEVASQAAEPETQESATITADQAVEPAPQEAVSAVTEKEPKERKGFKQFFTARRIAYIATFTALSFALRFFQVALLPAVAFLKLDFSDVFVLICAYALGPVSGVITGVLKEALYALSGFSSSMFVGELANILIMLPFVLIPSIMYKKHKGIKSVILWLSVACVVRTAWSIPVNWLLTFPAFLGFNWELGMSMFVKLWHWTTLFNFIKTVILAVIVLLLYKAVSRCIKLINAKFDKAKKAKSQKAQ